MAWWLNSRRLVALEKQKKNDSKHLTTSLVRLEGRYGMIAEKRGAEKLETRASYDAAKTSAERRSMRKAGE